MGGLDESNMATIETEAGFATNRIVDGRIIRVDNDVVLVDVGFKSEGTISRNEWDETEEQPKVGDMIKVLVEELEDEGANAEEMQGMVSLSKRKAKKILDWEEIIRNLSEGKVVTGTVTRKIKGGLLVDIGVNVFLPASQVDIRRPSDIGDYIGRTIQCMVLKIDEGRRNIVVSRRALIETERAEKKKKLLGELEIGQLRKGVVKNIAEFGAFVDLGGLDGLLHITDMSWGRIGHPSEMVAIDQELEVMVLHIDREKKKIALGLNHPNIIQVFDFAFRSSRPIMPSNNPSRVVSTPPAAPELFVTPSTTNTGPEYGLSNTPRRASIVVFAAITPSTHTQKARGRILVRGAKWTPFDRG